MVGFLFSSLVVVPEIFAKAKEGLDLPAKLSARQLKSRDHSLICPMICPMKFLQSGLRTDKKPALVDVRNKTQFDSFRIPGSLNIPLYAIRTKKFLRTKSIFLVNEGYGVSLLENECKKLNSLGFHARILEGGLNYWRDLGGNLEGNFFALEKVNEISSKNFFLDKDYEDWLVIDVSEASKAADDNPLPFAVHIPYSATANYFIFQVRKTMAEQQGDVLPFILVFNNNGKNYDPVKQTFKMAKIPNVYFLNGGIQAYKSFLHDQTLIWNPNRKTIKKCKSCP